MLMNTAPASLPISKADSTAGFSVPFGLGLCGTREQYQTVRLPCDPQPRTEINSSAESMSLKGLKEY